MIFRSINGKRIGVVYKITNEINGKCYVGQTVKELKQRWASHKHTNRRCPLTSAIKKYGYQSFTIEALVSVLDPDDLDEIEAFYIKEFNSVYPNGYNLLHNGNISKNNRGGTPWNKGLKASEETRQKLSDAHKGQEAWNAGLSGVYSKSTLHKMSLAKRGKHLSPETQYKPGQESTFKGKKHTPEALALISENGNRRAIKCDETGVTFPSILEASKALGVSKSYLRRKVIAGERIDKLNMTFRFA